MITIRQASLKDQNIVLKILDDFRTACMSIIVPEAHQISSTAKDSGAPVFNDVIKNPQHGAIFLAFDDEQSIGAISIYKIPQVRKGQYRGEIEEIFAAPEYQGKGIGKLLMEEAIRWAKQNNIGSIQLISNFHLLRAHSFYKKMGFIETSKSFERKL